MLPLLYSLTLSSSTLNQSCHSERSEESCKLVLNLVNGINAFHRGASDSTKKPPAKCKWLFGIRRRPTLPGRYQPSTIGTEGLNFCVRSGNRCDPFVIATVNGEHMGNRFSFCPLGLPCQRFHRSSFGTIGPIHRPFLPLRLPACFALSRSTCLHGLMYRTLTTAQLRFRI